MPVPLTVPTISNPDNLIVGKWATRRETINHPIWETPLGHQTFPTRGYSETIIRSCNCLHRKQWKWKPETESGNGKQKWSNHHINVKPLFSDHLLKTPSYKDHLCTKTTL